MIAPNTLLQNRYLVVNEIGQGGMGAVYIATDQRFGSTVALKETFFTDASMRKAFEREARLLNHLRHGALPKVIDHFTEDEGQFLVMEFISGDDLAEMLKERGAFSVSQILDWADQLLDALDYLHTQEPPVIHRDIKPQNLKITPRGHIVLLDFGLAKGAPVQLSRVTNTGSIFGYSRNYAPIEQIQGAGTDVRSDLYSLGATLYHLITGVTPPDALTRATAVLNHQPDPLQLANEVNAQVPRAVAQVIHRAMAQSSAQRPQTAEEMRKEMRQAASQAERALASSSAALPTVVNELSEQDTRIMGAGIPPTQAIADEPARKTERVGAETERMSASEIPPLMAASAQPTVTPPRASATALDSAAGLTVSDKGSIATKVREQQALSTQSPSSRRMFLIAASALLLLIVVAASYVAMRRSRAERASQAIQAQPQPSASSAASLSPSPAQSQVEASTQTEPTAEPTQTGHPAETSTSRIVSHPTEHRTQPHEESVQPAPQLQNDAKSAAAVPPPQQSPPPVGAPPNLPPRNDPGYWEARRQAAEQRRQEMDRRRMMRMERQIIQQQQRRRMGRP